MYRWLISHLLSSCHRVVQLKKETANIYDDTKLAIMSILPILCVCENPESRSKTIDYSLNIVLGVLVFLKFSHFSPERKETGSSGATESEV